MVHSAISSTGQGGATQPLVPVPYRFSETRPSYLLRYGIPALILIFVLAVEYIRTPAFTALSFFQSALASLLGMLFGIATVELLMLRDSILEQGTLFERIRHHEELLLEQQTSLSKELNESRETLLEVAASLGSVSSILHTEKDLLHQFSGDTGLIDSYLSSMKCFTQSYTAYLLTAGATTLRRTMRSAVMSAHVHQQAQDTRAGLYLSGVGLYLSILTALVKTLYTRTGRLVINACSTLRPSYWYNYTSITGARAANIFFQQYMAALQNMIAGGEIRVKRYLIFWDDQYGGNTELRARFAKVGIEPWSQARREGKLYIQLEGGQPKLYRSSEIVQSNLLLRNDPIYANTDDEAYLITENAHIPNGHLLVEDFVARVHSEPLDENARVVLLRENAKELLDNLPKSLRREGVTYGDFVSIGREVEGGTQFVCTVAAVLNPEYNLMFCEVFDDESWVESNVVPLQARLEAMSESLCGKMR